jgi:hypothetical protein
MAHMLGMSRFTVSTIVKSRVKIMERVKSAGNFKSNNGESKTGVW